jgi:hypothetical protein
MKTIKWSSDRNKEVFSATGKDISHHSDTISCTERYATQVSGTLVKGPDMHPPVEWMGL